MNKIIEFYITLLKLCLGGLQAYATRPNEGAAMILFKGLDNSMIASQTTVSTAPEPTIRKEFPETWIWHDLKNIRLVSIKKIK